MERLIRESKERPQGGGQTKAIKSRNITRKGSRNRGLMVEASRKEQKRPQQLFVFK
jgi:hypothetical protein